MDEANQQATGGSAKRKLPPRAIGLGLLVIDGFFIWLCILLPLHQAENHADSVSMTFKGILLVPALLVFGVLYSVAPKWTERFSTELENKKALIWTMAILGAMAGGLLYWLVKTKVESYGYKID